MIDFSVRQIIVAIDVCSDRLFLFRLLNQESINIFIEVKQVRSNRRKTQTSETSSVFEFPKIFIILESAKSGIIISFPSSSRLYPYSLRSIFVFLLHDDPCEPRNIALNL